MCQWKRFIGLWWCCDSAASSSRDTQYVAVQSLWQLPHTNAHAGWVPASREERTLHDTVHKQWPLHRYTAPCSLYQWQQATSFTPQAQNDEKQVCLNGRLPVSPNKSEFFLFFFCLTTLRFRSKMTAYKRHQASGMAINGYFRTLRPNTAVIIRNCCQISMFHSLPSPVE